MRSRSSRPASPARIGLAAIVIVALGAFTGHEARRASAQEAAASGDGAGIQTLHVTSREIVVDVMVTDAKGSPVHGLQQTDFSIEENGKPQPIRSFREYGSAEREPEPIGVKLPEGVYTNSKSMPVSGPVQILLLDAMHNPPALMDIAEQQAAKYLRSMPEGTRVAIFWMSENGLHLLQAFTSDREALAKAVSTNRADFGARGTGWTVQKTTIEELNQIAAYVSGIKGRKNLFWFAPGIPVNLLRDGGIAWGQRDMSMAHRLMDTYELLTAAQVAVYPVDPRGPGRMGMRQLKEEAVAEDTGGEAIYNTNDLSTALAKAVEEGSEVYTLSYIPPKQVDDGHYHHIEIKVDQPGLTLVYRKGYNAERTPTADAPAPGPALMKASMEGNAPDATQILFDVGVWPDPQMIVTPVATQAKKGSKPGPKTMPYEIRYGFPASQIAFAVGADGLLHGALEVDVFAYDINRARVAMLSQTVKMPLSQERYAGFVAKPFRLTQHLDLPLGQLTLHVGILDNVDNKVGTVEIPLLVSPNAAPGTPGPGDVAPCPPRCPLTVPAPAFSGPR